jgi:lipopolysaccharide/colanic/teichoic acid biosynthesis glycosyltransferase
MWLLYLLLERDKGPFLYQGTRLGLHKRPFTIYKVRTLVSDAEHRLGSRLCRESDVDLHTRYGDFLRRTRLDELPQLLNILRGDMAFVGPRPERPAVCAERLMSLPGYVRRFEVRPGLTGISQFLTPHGTPKRMRIHLDNRYARSRPGFLLTLGLVLRTVMLVGFNLLREMAQSLWLRLRRPFLPRRWDLGWQPTPRYGSHRIGISLPGTLMDIRDESLLLESPHSWEAEHELCFHLWKRVRGHRRTLVHCSGHVRPAGEGRWIVTFATRSPMNQYRLEKHLLRKSIC